LFARLGISILASSAVSQHRLPSDHPTSATNCIAAFRAPLPTKLRPLKELQLNFGIQQPLHGLYVLFGFESREDIEIVIGLVEDPVDR